ncbi:hypothetical protein GCM10019071_05780 [Sphingobium fuliginis]|uniref:Secreted protein n=1 Tax=Sphingobium fuliginis (strain ATCC 27551) TaxID=336203 RepID=A0ABQ1ENE5_SPHSA|nr:hypothetical protein GCM10019071_05780 [Sphingobium fuliginis]
MSNWVSSILSPPAGILLLAVQVPIEIPSAHPAAIPMLEGLGANGGPPNRHSIMARAPKGCKRGFGREPTPQPRGRKPGRMPTEKPFARMRDDYFRASRMLT